MEFKEMERKTWWQVVVWGSGFGENCGLCRSLETAKQKKQYLVEKLGWDPESIVIKEMHLTREEWKTIARQNKVTNEWMTGPRGGSYRMSGTGRSRIYR